MILHIDLLTDQYSMCMHRE